MCIFLSEKTLIIILLGLTLTLYKNCSKKGCHTKDNFFYSVYFRGIISKPVHFIYLINVFEKNTNVALSIFVTSKYIFLLCILMLLIFIIISLLIYLQAL